MTGLCWGPLGPDILMLGPSGVVGGHRGPISPIWVPKRECTEASYHLIGPWSRFGGREGTPNVELQHLVDTKAHFVLVDVHVPLANR